MQGVFCAALEVMLGKVKCECECGCGVWCDRGLSPWEDGVIMSQWNVSTSKAWRVA